jgi:hypothetical protein
MTVIDINFGQIVSMALLANVRLTFNKSLKSLPSKWSHGFLLNYFTGKSNPRAE